MVEQLECRDYIDTWDLDGVVHFCNHVRREQELELAGMRQWLADRDLEGPGRFNCSQAGGGRRILDSDGHGGHGDGDGDGDV